MLCLMILLMFYGGSDGNCEGGSGNACCSGFTWDAVRRRCVECRAGYFGINCSNQCPFPSYGRHCQQECRCTLELCDVSEGCGIQTTQKVVTEHNDFNSTIKSTWTHKITILKGNSTYTAEFISTDTIYKDTSLSEKDSQIVYYTVLGDIRPILYAIFSVIVLFVILASTYIIGKRIHNSQCNKRTSAIREGNMQEDGVYQEINSIEHHVTYSVCRTNDEEALVEISELCNGERDTESNEEKDFGQETTNVKTTSMG